MLLTAPLATLAFAEPGVCTGLGLNGSAFGACQSYCEAMRCDADSPASANACQRLGNQLLSRARAQGVELAVVDGVVQCNAGDVGGPFEPIPADASEWVCKDSTVGPTPEQVDAWCAANIPDNLGTPLPEHLRHPPPLHDLEAKNAYDLRMKAFLIARAYDLELHWNTDTEWRFTGPITGSTATGANGNNTIASYATHFPVKIAYSPEVVEWLCAGRSYELPNGAAIIKPMRLINSNLDIQPGDDGIVEEGSDGCMDINNQEATPLLWTSMIKTSAQSYDGWYWSTIIMGPPQLPNGLITDPPILDKSGITTERFYDATGNPPQAPNPEWYPSGYWYPPDPNKWPNIIMPLSEYGHGCVSCHSSADSDNTFADLANLMGYNLRYKRYAEEELPFGKGGNQHAFPGLVTHSELELNGDSIALNDDENKSPFTKPLIEPGAEFLAFFNQLGPVAFENAWINRLPAQTYDHVISAPGGPDSFLTSDQCSFCHNAVPLINTLAPMTVVDIDPHPNSGPLVNLSPFGEWSASPMGMAGRDPIFYSQLQSETNNLPDAKACIENTCLHCHGVMGQRQLATDFPHVPNDCEDIFAVPPPKGVAGVPPLGRRFSLDMVQQWPGSLHNEEQKYAALARDGISCTVCHRISEDSINTEAGFTGNFVTGPADQINGPYDDVITKPMNNALGLTPGFGAQIADAGLCGSCHNILLPNFSNEGEILGYSYEQTTHLEWTNSIYAQPGPNAQTCQDCHMQNHYRGDRIETQIANIETADFPPTTHRLPDADITVKLREDFSRHTLLGLNIFLNEIAQQFPLLLGYRQGQFVARQLFSLKPALLLSNEAYIDQAQNETADVQVTQFGELDDGRFQAIIEVTNKAGHYLPSGVGFRRLFLEVLVRDRQGRTLWASGRTNELGAILDGRSDNVLRSEEPVNYPDEPFQPHYQTITREDQVQIYQELIADSDGELTTSFLRRVTGLKDNRIRPHGYDPAFFLASDSEYINALTDSTGEEALDPYYQDPSLTGSDVIKYVMDIDKELRGRVNNIEVTLYSQSIPPFYLQQRFRDANRGPAEKGQIERLHYITSHLNVDDTIDRDGRSVLKNWKFFVASDEKQKKKNK